MLTQEENQKRSDELKEAATPLVDYLYKYGCPHSCIIVAEDHVEMLSGDCAVPLEVRD